MPSPWLILGFLVALGTAWFAGDHHGTAETEQRWKLSTQQMTIDYNAKLKAAQDAKESVEHAYNDLKDKTEGQHAQDQSDIAAANRRAHDAVSHGLPVAKRCGDGSFGTMPGDSKPVGGDAGGATDEFYLLQRSATVRLGDRYAEADNFLSLYRACRIRLLDAITKSKAPR